MMWPGLVGVLKPDKPNWRDDLIRRKSEEIQALTSEKNAATKEVYDLIDDRDQVLAEFDELERKVRRFAEEVRETAERLRQHRARPVD